MEDLEADPDDAGEEEQADDVRVDKRIQDAREDAGLGVVDLRAREVQHIGALGVLRLVAVELDEQRGQGRSNEIDHVHVQRLLCGEVRGDPNGLPRPRRVALVRGGERRE